jgi:purine-nucleoside phosphorylase
LASSLEARTGLTWSLDAPYRETAAEIQGCQAEGVLTVDMEAAALFAVGQSCGIRTGAVFVISDHLDSAGWRQGGDESRVHKTLHTALDTLIRVVA